MKSAGSIRQAGDGTADNMDQYVEKALDQQATGWRFPFTIERADGSEVIGTSSFYEPQRCT